MTRQGSSSQRIMLSRSRRLHDGAQVVAGTAWLWAREDYFEAVDVLFVDEAGQMSLANVLALSQAAKKPGASGRPAAIGAAIKGQPP